MFGPFDLIAVGVLLGIASDSVMEIFVGTLGYSSLVIMLAKLNLNPYMQAIVRRNLEAGQGQALSHIRPFIQSVIFVGFIGCLVFLIINML